MYNPIADFFLRSGTRRRGELEAFQLLMESALNALL